MRRGIDIFIVLFFSGIAIYFAIDKQPLHGLPFAFLAWMNVIRARDC